MLFALDVAASELYDEKLNAYVFDGESRMHGQKVLRCLLYTSQREDLRL